MFKFALALTLALTGAAALPPVGGVAVPVTTAALPLVGSMAVPVTAAVAAEDHQKTPAECPLTLLGPELVACSELYAVWSSPTDPHGVGVYLPTSDTIRADGSLVWAVEWPRDRDTAGGSPDAITIPAAPLTFQHFGLPLYTNDDGQLTLTSRTQYGMGTGATSWEVWPTPSFGVATWTDAAGFVYRPTSVGTDTFALRVCRETTDEIQTYVTFTQCSYLSMKFTITA